MKIRKAGTIKNLVFAGALALLGAWYSTAAWAAITFHTADTSNTTISTVGLSAATLGNATLATPSTLTTGTNNFRYAAIQFSVTTSGAYNFGMTTASSDTVMILYQGIYDPANPGTGALVGNDDTPAATHRTVLGDPTAVISCGGGGLCPWINFNVTAGFTYTLWVSGFSVPNSNALALPFQFYSDAPVIFGVYTGKSPIDLMEPFYLASELDVTVDPIFVGGTLRMNEIGQTYAQDFTLANLASSTIDQNGNHSVFSGEFTDAVAGTPGYITIAGTSGSVTFSGTNNTYTGTTTVSTGPLRAGAVNTLSPSSNMVVATNGRLELNGYSQAVAGLTHSGFISLSGSGVVGTELSTTNYIGGGILAMNTTLGVDGSPSDVLVIDSGTATGTTTLRITNVGGSGAQTTGDGILVVEAINGATTSSGAFVLETSPLIVGNYRYQLYQGGLGGSNPNNWYLRGTLISPTNLAVSVPALNPAALVLLAFALAGLALQRRRRGA